MTVRCGSGLGHARKRQLPKRESAAGRVSSGEEPPMTRSLSRRRVLSLAAVPLASLLSPLAQAKDRRMRVFITGSTDGLGRAAARTLIDEGHQVVLHARSKQRASALACLLYTSDAADERS